MSPPPIGDPAAVQPKYFGLSPQNYHSFEPGQGLVYHVPGREKKRIEASELTFWVHVAEMMSAEMMNRHQS